MQLIGNLQQQPIQSFENIEQSSFFLIKNKCVDYIKAHYKSYFNIYRYYEGCGEKDKYYNVAEKLFILANDNGIKDVSIDKNNLTISYDDLIELCSLLVSIGPDKCGNSCIQYMDIKLDIEEYKNKNCKEIYTIEFPPYKEQIQ